MDLIMLPCLRNTRNLNARVRVNAAIKAINDTFEVDPVIMFGEPLDVVKDEWVEYLKLPVENCSKYELIKKKLISLLGNAIFMWLRDYTNYLGRNTIMIKKNKKDCIAERIVDII